MNAVIVALLCSALLPLRPGAATAGRPEDTGAAADVLDWNATARQLVARGRLDPPAASRVYALLSVAQHRAFERAPAGGRAAAAAAAHSVLSRMFPALIPPAARAPADRVDDDFGDRRTDGAEAAGRLLVWPSARGLWRPDDDAAAPVRPFWGRVRPWLLAHGDTLRPPPPPVPGSPAFEAALAEVRRLSDRRAPEHVRAAERWADGAGTPTPPGHWNAIAADLLRRRAVSDRVAARVLATLNMAMMDAGIAAWEAKYLYRTLRPWQADPAIVPVVGRPNFPSYVSGHSAFSAAAATVLGHFFPDEADALQALAREASDSRVLAGVHYRFDCAEGWKIGRAVGRLATQRAT